MTNQEIYDLIACFERSSLQTLRLSRQDFSIELSRGGSAAAAPAAPAAMPAPAAVSAAPREADGEAITAPLVGTFYAAPAPDQPPFVSVGDRVMMSEVPAPCDCIIEAVLKENGELAAFGEPLLRYKPC